MLRPKIVFYGEHTASLSLYLDGLPPYLAGSLEILTPSGVAHDMPLLAAAGLVVHVRGFASPLVQTVSRALDMLGVPRAWFTDDDLTALAMDQPGFAAYTPTCVAAFAANLVAVIGTTHALCARLAMFHPSVLYWPCILDHSLLDPIETREELPVLRLAAFGGDFRAAGLEGCVLPALSVLPGATLIVTQTLASAAPEATVLPFEADFRRFVARWRACQPDIVVHPPGRTANLPAKGPGSLLAALYLGAVPVVADEPAYAGLGFAEGVVQAGRDPASWRQALASLADAGVRRQLLVALRRYCVATYGPAPAELAITALQARAARPGLARSVRLLIVQLLVAVFKVRQRWRSRRGARHESHGQ